MNSNERREKLLHILKTSNRPVKGVDLAKELNVTRQIVVKDIALLRASGIDILATSTGYIIYTIRNQEFKIKCKNHYNDENLLLELQTIIDLGGKVKDVIVDHPTYGTIKAELNLASNRDLKIFMENSKKNGFKQLSSLTQNYHVHTIEVTDENTLEEIKKELKEVNILL
ncbi:transcription repressor NadR [Terrisporobacter mayombei]|uniref:Transcription repressor NiaR n=1 Tax=Terrisporobacter mayombei TaxID=1541 RepID=A0ABY9Q576_9FIRM|nr:transcription repressor NadR [Terrisporobacter mayombei]MCC3868736.1 transcription repressor NadR [Terrisporobacter mayombei]WMT83137.1 putative transcription repressor NiaR [Terrisporobacter mayombei]